MNTLPATTPVVHAGLDVAKATLQLHLRGRQHALPNTPQGHRQTVDLLRAVPGAHLVCEATAGYEQALVAALHAAAIPVSVINPARVRHFARAQGRQAKNDPLDATVLTAFGQALRPAPTPVPDAGLAELRALVRWRAHLLAQRVATGNRSEHGATDFVARQQAKLGRQLAAQIAAAETELRAALKRLPRWQAALAQLTELDGVGFSPTLSPRFAAGRGGALPGAVPRCARPAASGRELFATGRGNLESSRHDAVAHPASDWIHPLAQAGEIPGAAPTPGGGIRHQRARTGRGPES
jgi:transposase